MAHLREIGTVVYLKLGYKALARRLGNLKTAGWFSARARPSECSTNSAFPVRDIRPYYGGLRRQDIEHTLDRVLRALEKRNLKKNASL